MKQEEHQEQAKLVQWLRLKKIFHFAIPNGAALKGTPLQRAKQMNKLKAEGLITGTSDIVVMLENKILFIELKRKRKKLKSGNLSQENLASKEQLDFLKHIVDNYSYADGLICYGFDEAREFIESYKK